MATVHEIALQIYDVCPPSDCLVIGLGRSPTPFVADLSTAAQDYVWNVPLSNFVYNDFDGEISETQLSAAERSKLFAHLNVFLPPAELTRGKKLLLVDYADSGVSLLSAQRYCQEYLDNEYPDPKTRPQLESFAITVPGNYLPNLTQNRPDFLFNIPAKAHEFTYKVSGQDFDEESEYGSFLLVAKEDSKSLKRQEADPVPKERKSSKVYLELVEKMQNLRTQLKLEPFSDHDHQKLLETKTATASNSFANDDGYTPVVEAALQGKIETFKLLLKSAIQFTPSSLFFLPDNADERETLATWVTMEEPKNCGEILKIIADEYPDLLFIRNDDGYTPAHIAIKTKNLTALKAILDNGPKELVTVKDFSGHDLFETAKVEGVSAEISEYLESVKAR